MTDDNKVIAQDHIQVALFPIDFVIDNPTKMWTNLLNDQIIQSDDKSVVNSFLRSNAPSDIVRLEATVKDSQNSVIKVAQSKISLHWENLDSQLSFEVKPEVIINTISKIWSTLLKGKKINRIGYISTIFKKISKPSEILSEYLSFKSIEYLVNANITLTCDFSIPMEPWKNTKFNKHLIISDGIINKTKEKVILIQYDLNTKKDQLLDWDMDTATRFISEAIKIVGDPKQIYESFFNS